MMTYLKKENSKDLENLMKEIEGLKDIMIDKIKS